MARSAGGVHVKNYRRVASLDNNKSVRYGPGLAALSPTEQCGETDEREKQPEIVTNHHPAFIHSFTRFITVSHLIIHSVRDNVYRDTSRALCCPTCKHMLIIGGTVAEHALQRPEARHERGISRLNLDHAPKRRPLPPVEIAERRSQSGLEVVVGYPPIYRRMTSRERGAWRVQNVSTTKQRELLVACFEETRNTHDRSHASGCTSCSLSMLLQFTTARTVLFHKGTNSKERWAQIAIEQILLSQV